MDTQKRGGVGPIVHEDFLRVYYDRLFPTETFVQWLSCDNDVGHHRAERSLICREFAFDSAGIFTLHPNDRSDVEQDAKALHDFLVQRCPQKLDVGPIYNVDPSKRSTYAGMGDGFYCKERELVFDIDMDEYDDVRTCCSEGKMCHKDWAYIAAAILVMDASLREDFGFQHILWVYSGRRGIHCWVCDKRAKELSDRERSAVAEFLAVYKGQQKGCAKLSFTNRAHPSMERALRICRDVWMHNILPEQRLFESEKHTEAIYEILGDVRIRNSVSQAPSRIQDEDDINQHTWRCIEKEIDKLASRQDARKKAEEAVQNCDRVVLTHVYPRLDIMVSKTKNHLLKAPFCVHPKTGRICVPVLPEKLWEFNPETVPTVQELFDELNQSFHEHQENTVEQTALSPYLRYFQEFVTGLQSTSQEELSVS